MNRMNDLNCLLAEKLVEDIKKEQVELPLLLLIRAEKPSMRSSGVSVIWSLAKK